MKKVLTNWGKRYSLLKDISYQVDNPAFDTYHYLKHEFLSLQPCAFYGSYSLWNEKSKQTVIHLPLFMDNKEVTNPCRAPFGGIQHQVKADSDLLFDFLLQVESDLRLAKVDAIKLAFPPLIYDPESAAVSINSLLRIGYSVTTSKINHYLPVSNSNFNNIISPSANRRLQKCHRQEFGFKQEPLQFLPQAYSFLVQCRQEKQHSISLSLKTLEKQVEQMPERYSIFSVKDGDNLISISIAVRVNSEVLYNFYPASLKEYNDYSPAIMLTEGIYDFARQNKFRLVDLGTSMLGDSPNVDLMRFKKSIGGKESLNFDFKKEL
ncbi:GNAT family N-acetyltransferase [Rufibacter hautae]|uniref:GNAT family N-acetyltransferase n=1 Tax=Rufibacter hautae TaxID=2595005 RepID=A0A5B6THA5_9BACT|nr:GNAT family N-acetyltransferase [Rufibacter hautae]KAA3439386.1 GNAT family N-acetyltransferase [Rufibacter hautae]